MELFYSRVHPYNSPWSIGKKGIDEYREKIGGSLSVPLDGNYFICLFFLNTPGPGFGIYTVVHLLLPTMFLWLHRNHSDHFYWDMASANFKHAIGLSCELVVEHIQSFIHSGKKINCSQ